MLCSNRASQELYHIGLVADFSGRCPDDECDEKCPGCMTYRCSGCRHRWKWIDGSPTPDPARGDFDIWNQDHPYQDRFEAYKCGMVQSISSVMAWYSRRCEALRKAFICKRRKSPYVGCQRVTKPVRVMINQCRHRSTEMGEGGGDRLKS